MLIGIMCDENSEYKIYKNGNTFRVDKIFNNKVKSLDKKEVLKLLNILVESKKTFLKKSKHYDIYIDEAGNKRFFKDGMEDFKMFFLMNGVEAKSYIGSSKDGKVKGFIVKHSKVICLICSITIFTEVGFFLTDIRSPLSGPRYHLEQVAREAIIGEYTSDDLKNLILNSDGENLTDAKKFFFANKIFLDDVIKYGNTDKIPILVDKLEDFDIGYFTEEFKKENDLVGQYRPLTPSNIFLKDNSYNTFKDAGAHEFVHLTQQNFKYSYIREACAEIMAHEYFNSGINTYFDQISRIYFLTEIVGTDLMFEANFNTNPKNFENEIINLLGEKDGQKMLKLLDTRPADDNIEEVNKEIDKYLYQMYITKYGEEALEENIWFIQKFYVPYFVKYEINKFFFNRHDPRYYKNIVKDPNELNFIPLQLNEITDDDILKIFIGVRTPITKEEYDKYKRLDIPVYVAQNVKKGYLHFPDGVINVKTREETPMDKALKLGLINPEYYTLETKELNSLSEIHDYDLSEEEATIIYKDGFYSTFKRESTRVLKNYTDKSNYYSSIKDESDQKNKSI